jgi:hypothetical protein
MIAVCRAMLRKPEMGWSAMSARAAAAWSRRQAAAALGVSFIKRRSTVRPIVINA